MASKKAKSSAKLRKAKAIEWRERLIKIERMPASALLDHPLNPKIHPDAQKEPLAGLLSEVGKVDILKAYLSERNEGALTLWDGHCRRELRPDEMWNVGIYDLTDAEADLLLATFDPIGWQAEQSKQRLESLMDTIKAGNSHVVSFLAEQGARLGIINQLNGHHGEAQDAEPQIDRAAELNRKWKVESGQLWLIGEHRLLCGDSTRTKDVARVMNGEKADLLLTDPPYNVAYTGKTKEALTIDNDEMSDPAFRDFLVKAFSAAFASLKAGGGYYIWHADSEGYNFRGAVFDIGQKVRQCLVWAKNTLVMGRQDYHWKHEPCLYGWKEGAAHSWHSDRTQTTLLEFDRPTSSQEHPTMKPVALFEYLIGNSSGKGETVLDTFGGSGTTLVAAQNTGRKGRTVELSPDYCAVILERMQTAFPSLTIKREGGEPIKARKR